MLVEELSFDFVCPRFDLFPNTHTYTHTHTHTHTQSRRLETLISESVIVKHLQPRIDPHRLRRFVFRPILLEPPAIILLFSRFAT